MTHASKTCLVLEVGSEEELRQLYQRDLRKGRAYVAHFETLPPRAPCTLVIALRSSAAKLELAAEAVFSQPSGPSPGIGVELTPFDSQVRSTIEAFVNMARPSAEDGAPSGLDSGDALSSDGGARQSSLYDKIRGLSLRERDAVARTGTLPERVALERCFGGSVWEGLLQNPQLTPPEIARMAKNGALSKPLVSLIVSNAGWVAKPEVQRALLGNPRVTGTHLDRVLRSLPRLDLALVEKNPAYRMAVRASAKKLLGS